MSIEIEGVAPGSEAAQALAELAKEGQTVEGTQPPAPEEKPPEEKKEEPKVEDKVEPKPEDRPNRTPSMVEAWKLKVAEDQKDSLAKSLAEAETKLKELSEQKQPITADQKVEINDDIEAVLKEAEADGADVTYLRKLADALVKKAGPSQELQKTLQEIKQKEALAHELNEYANEFDKDVLPLVREKYPQLSETALSTLKDQLKDLAFSETYAKVPLKEIFQIKESTLGITVPKRASEGKGVKGRATDILDMENLDEESFQKLPDEKILEIAERKTGGWNTRK